MPAIEVAQQGDLIGLARDASFAPPRHPAALQNVPGTAPSSYSASRPAASNSSSPHHGPSMSMGGGGSSSNHSQPQQQQRGPNGERYVHIPRRDKHTPAAVIKILDDHEPPRRPPPTMTAAEQNAPRQRPQPGTAVNTVRPVLSSAQHFLTNVKQQFKQPLSQPNVSQSNNPVQPPAPIYHPLHGYKPPADNVYSTTHPTNKVRPLDADPLGEGPKPSLYGGPMIKPEERDRQLQEMISNMVDLSDVDPARSRITGLTCELMPHQIQGVNWMVQREKGKEKGGILADDMGLGKTVQTLALIVSNRPSLETSTIRYIEEAAKSANSKKANSDISGAGNGPSRREIELKSQTTLIVAPLAVIRQWEQEIKTKSDAGLKVYVHHGTGRAKSAESLKGYDVVITTYTTAAAEWGNTLEGQQSVKSKRNGKGKGKDEEEPEWDSSSDSDSANDSGDGKDDSDSSVEVVKGPGRQTIALRVRSPSKPKGSKAKMGGTRRMPKKATCAPAPLFDMHWLRVVLDEAQNIKNHRAKCSLASYALSRKAHAKWCLSGTPIQNTSYELYSLIHFLGIPPFNEYRHFKEKIGEPLQSTNQNRINWGLKRLRIVLGAIMLRRTKDAEHEGKKILSLPPREVQIVETDFEDPAEREFYSALERKMQETLKEAQQEDGKINRMGALVMLLRLRQACSHPALTMKNIAVDALASTPGSSTSKSIAGSSSNQIQSKTTGSNASDTDEADDLVSALAGLTVGQNCDMCRVQLGPGSGPRCEDCQQAIKRSAASGRDWLSPGRTSTKINTMVRMLTDFHKDAPAEKAIVFSQFTSFLDLVEPFLKEEGLNYVRYDGSMRPDARETALHTIKNRDDCKIILISFKAGSTGLNLTCCSRVLLMDLWWNPQIEEQAFDRAHRLGQTRAVRIYKLSVKDSVEQRLLDIQKKKRELANSALTGERLQKGKKSQLSWVELLYLFGAEP
ncbi:hypothetical protein K437DRAFT_259799 [Tilletiaria anomala UBC 951]|uniref:P-loop containing nucleoside triphosphate hydrolase protein n=1 Tax=Tilletiaria anomala (strain ATCC 24038 / CBS 436.72 / UBC 951) TaxID=1037660 RepID=A0A066VF89_TILAU|nr:uncharacterized protein K437DRAFT_259799 [Tilletiaria anomala UBC 951]KDN37414.1 hypothetical protein K437DRAFT_259799 [Tilletiaria anomala UBC 951]